MNCNYCESKAQYAFAGGGRMCAMCLASLPSDMVSARAEVARLRDELATVTVQRDELLAKQTPCVPPPTTADEAAAMQMVGTAWLYANAPERLKAGSLEPLTYIDMDYPPEERTTMRAYTAGWNDCLSKIGGVQP